MAGRSILYLGDSEFAADFVENLKSATSCRYFGRSPSLTLRDIPEWVELILFEVGPGIAELRKRCHQAVVLERDTSAVGGLSKTICSVR